MVNEQTLKQIFFSPGPFPFLSLFMNPTFPMLMYHCTLWCVTALTRQHIITTSVFNFWTSLADDTWLFTLQCFSLLIYNHVAPQDIIEHFNELSFLYNHDEAPITSN